MVSLPACMVGAALASKGAAPSARMASSVVAARRKARGGVRGEGVETGMVGFPSRVEDAACTRKMRCASRGPIQDCSTIWILKAFAISRQSGFVPNAGHEDCCADGGFPVPRNGNLHRLSARRTILEAL